MTPDTLEVRPSNQDGTWSVSIPPDKIVGIYGYNFRSDALPRVELQNARGQRLREAKLTTAYVTQYQLNLDFSEEDFQQAVDGVRFVLQWPDRSENNTIAVALIRPALLKIASVSFQPAQPRAKKDMVSPTIIVSNQGGLDSRAFVITWKPGPNEILQSLTIQNLGPGQQTSITFPGYVYPSDGAFATSISLAEGSDYHQSMVTVTPFAIVPYERTIGIRGQWPAPGGEPGQTKQFTFDAGVLDSGCILDESRGGGAFEVVDVNKPEVKYLITWPNGYDFNFTDGTSWRSFSALAVDKDQQTHMVNAIVTLKGLGGHGPFASRGPERFNGSFTIYYKCGQ